MSASLVRKALDETTLASEEKLDNLSKISKKKFKPQKKSKKVNKDKLLKQNLKILKSLEYRGKQKSQGSLGATPTPEVKVDTDSSVKKANSRKNKSKKKDTESVFTEEDFEKFEKEYFVTA